MDAPDGVHLSESDQIPAYRVFQEALNNAARHSGGQEAQVNIAQNARHFRMDIHDDGTWLPRGAILDDANAPRGLGMRSMFSRARLMGGELEIRSLEKGGTIVSLCVPTGRGGGGA